MLAQQVDTELRTRECDEVLPDLAVRERVDAHVRIARFDEIGPVLAVAVERPRRHRPAERQRIAGLHAVASAGCATPCRSG